MQNNNGVIINTATDTSFTPCVVLSLSTKPNTIVLSDSEEEEEKVKLEQQSDQR